VNPVAMLLTCALMLEELGHAKPAAALQQGVEKAVAENQTTRDLGGALSTKEAAAAIRDHALAALK
jgi:3-isopropylmalate dehydrogenase